MRVAAGGAVGAVLGALVGPLAAVFWGASGALVACLTADDREPSAEILSSVTRVLPHATIALIAELDERAHGLPVVDRALRTAGGTVVRRSREDIRAELVEADQAARAGQRVARRALHRRRRQDG